MLLQTNGSALPSLPAPPQLEPVSLLNLLLITLTLLVSYYAYRTQHLKTDILDVSVSEGAMEFLVKNMSHTSHVVLRIKLRAWLPGEPEPRDLEEFSLDPEASNLDYLYPERSGTSKAPDLPYRVELGPLDFTRFRTRHPNVVVVTSTTPGASDWQEGGTVGFPVSGGPPETMADLEHLRDQYIEGVEKSLEDDPDNRRPPPIYSIPEEVKRIVLEVHQTGEEYVLVERDGEWHIVSKRRREVKIDGAEYQFEKKLTPVNWWYWFKYDLRWYLIDP